jgi:hypothetical protein
LLRDYAALGVSRVIGLIYDSATSDEALAAFADDARSASVEMSESTALGA